MENSSIYDIMTWCQIYSLSTEQAAEAQIRMQQQQNHQKQTFNKFICQTFKLYT